MTAASHIIATVTCVLLLGIVAGLPSSIGTREPDMARDPATAREPAIVGEPGKAREPDTSREPDTALQRIQTYRNSLRGVAYLERHERGGEPGTERIDIAPMRVIPLGGDPDLNVHGNLYPIQADATPGYELLHFNGYRQMRVLDFAGRVLWQLDQPRARTHRGLVDRDTLAVWDLDGDGREEIVHCWTDGDGTRQRLVIRRGSTGEELRSRGLAGAASERCLLALFHFEGHPEPLILVPQASDEADCAPFASANALARIVAFDLELRRVWERETCGAGHYFWPLDEDGDARADFVFAGKYKLDARGRIDCVLEGMGVDHVDSAVVTDLMAAPGIEIAIAAETGLRVYGTRDCELRWMITRGQFANPQSLVAAKFGPEARYPLLVVRQKSIEPRRLMAFVDGRGRILDVMSSYEIGISTPFVTAELDGARGRQEVVAVSGLILGRQGRRRADAAWYRQLEPADPADDLPLHRFERWASHPVVFDLDDDGVDEIITWGRHAIVIGKARAASD